jgi:hypothetical protein
MQRLQVQPSIRTATRLSLSHGVPIALGAYVRTDLYPCHLGYMAVLRLILGDYLAMHVTHRRYAFKESCRRTPRMHRLPQ